MKRLSAALLTLLFVCSLLSFSACFTSKYQLINDNDESVFYTPEELEPVFEAYHGDFAAAAHVILENEELRRIMVDSGEYDVIIDDDFHKQMFSAEEWELIVKLFKETGLSRIERKQKYGPELEVVDFIFREADEPDIWEFFSMHPKLEGKTTELFYLSTEEDIDLFISSKNADCEVFYKLEDNWWVGYLADENIGKIKDDQNDP